MAQLNSGNARRICELIFNEYADSISGLNARYRVTFQEWGFSDIGPNTASAIMVMLESGNFRGNAQFDAWWADRLAGSTEDDLLIQEMVSKSSYIARVRRVWKEVLAERVNSIGDLGPELTEEDGLTEIDMPEGWVREPADLYIGPHAVNIPGPEAIGVHEDYGISGVDSLRTDSDPVWREPVSRVDITIDAVYASETELNEKFRPLVAFLRATPLTVLQSPLLNTVMLRQLQDKEIFSIIAAAQKDWESNQAAIKDMFKDMGMDDDRTLSEFKEAIRLENETGAAIARLAETYVPSPNLGQIPGPLPHVPVMCTGIQVQSISEGTHTFRARFMFTFLNDFAVSSDGLRFLDSEGHETDSVWECAWLKRYVELGWLLDQTSEMYLEEYPIGGRAMTFFYDSDLAPFAVKPVIEDGRDIIVEGVMCSYSNKVAHLPLLGQELPSCQYLGRANATCEVMLNCSLEGIERITRVKSSIEKNIHNEIKILRDDRIRLQLPIVNTMGFKDFVITRVHTTTEEQMTDRYRVLITMIENRVKVQNRETLVLNNQSLTRKIAKSLWDHIWSIYNKFWDGTLPREEIGQYEYARGLLFGNGSDALTSCLVNSDVLRAMTWADPELREFLGEFYSWIEGRGVVRTNDKWFKTYKDQSTNTGGRFSANTEIIFSGGKLSGVEPEYKAPTQTKFFEVHLGKPALEDFYHYWRLMMQSSEEDPKAVGQVGIKGHNEIGRDSSPETLRRIQKTLRAGKIVIKKEMQDALFNAVWNRQSPKKYSHLDRNHRVWQAKRELAVYKSYPKLTNENDDPAWKIDENGLRANSLSLLKEYQDEKQAPVAAKYDRDNPYADIENSFNLWDRNRVNDAFRSLQMIAINMPDLFPSWTIDGEDPRIYTNHKVGIPVSRGLEAGKPIDLRSLSCYPDFALPTYRQLFTYGGGLTTLWKRFAPTIEELGLPEESDRAKVRRQDTKELMAVAVDDLVEPTFYYAKGRYKREAIKMEAGLLSNEAIAMALQKASFINLEMTMTSLTQLYGKKFNVTEHIHEKLKNLIVNTDEAAASRSPRDRQMIADLMNPANKDVTEVKFTTSDNFVVATAKPKKGGKPGEFEVVPMQTPGRRVQYVDSSAEYNTKDPTAIRKALQDILARFPEDKQDVKRCFPTFRLRFIDFDSGFYSDEFYEYNAVRSIHVYRDKNDAATCEIDIANSTGILDNDSFFTEDEHERTGIAKDDEEKSIYDERAGRYLKSIKLREGTAIQLLMGYSPDANRLETVFTGRIAQVQMGDIVSIIAQGYKTELLNEMSFQGEDVKFKELVRTVFQHLDAEGHVKDIEANIAIDERKNGTPHLGTRSDMANTLQKEEYNRAMKTLFGSEKLRAGNTGFKKTGPFGWNFAQWWETPEALTYSLDGRSYIDLFAPRPSRMRNIGLRKQAEASLDNWTCTYQSGFDALREMASFMPGWIVDVVPYDHFATVYVGPPDGEYYWTSKYNADITQNYRHNLPQQASKDKIDGIVKLMEDLHIYIQDWISKKEYEDMQRGLHLPRTHEPGVIPEEWLPDSIRHRNIAGIVGDMKKRNDKVFEALVGAFFGFDLVTQTNYDVTVDSAIRTIINKVASSDGRVYDPALRFANPLLSDEDPFTSISFYKSLEDDIEFIVANTYGFKNYLYQMSHFNDMRIQEAVARLTFMLDSPWKKSKVYPENLETMTTEEIGGEVVTDQNSFNWWKTAVPVALLHEGYQMGDRYLRGLDMFGDNFVVEAYPPRSFEQYYGHYVRRYTFNLKVYLYLMSEFLTKDVSDDVVKVLGADIADTRDIFRSPDRRPFRQYHHITSRYDIVSNNIVASMKEMANTVLLRYADKTPEYTTIDSPNDAPDTFILNEADTSWKVFKHPDGLGFHPSIKLEQKKLAITVEKNAHSEEAASNVFLNRMGQALRPMYRGNLVLWGRAIKPHDVIQLNDSYNEMTGQIEVERVIHHFTPQSGWTTTVIPHAKVNIDNAIDVFQASVLERWLNVASVGLDIVNWTAIVFAVISLGSATPLAGGVRALGGYAKRAFDIALGRSIKEIAKKAPKAAASAVASAAGSTAATTTAQSYPVVLVDPLEAAFMNLYRARKAARTGTTILGRETVAATVEQVGFNQISKGVGQHMAPWLKNGIRSVSFWGGFSLVQMMTEGLASSIAESGAEDIQGLVSISPLIFEGHPLVAGLDYDDRYYLSQFEQGWKYISERPKAMIGYVSKNVNVFRAAGDRGVNDSYGAPLSNRGRSK